MEMVWPVGEEPGSSENAWKSAAGIEGGANARITERIFPHTRSGVPMALLRNVLFQSVPGVRRIEKLILVAQKHLELVCRALESICIVFGIVVILALDEIVIGLRVNDELEWLAGGG